MQTLEASSAWERGATLADALEFSDPVLFAEFSALFEKLFSLIPPVDLRPLYANSPPLPLPYDPVKDVPRLYEMEEHLKSKLIHMLKNGDLVSVGYPLPRNREQQPEWIPSNRWLKEGTSWNTSGLWGEGYAYEDVRILRSPQSTLAEIIAEVPDPEPYRRRGRPRSPRPLILRAYEELRDKDRINFNSLERNLPLIRAAVLRVDNSAKGLGKQTVRSTISEQFARDREARGYSKKLSKKSSKNKIF